MGDDPAAWEHYDAVELVRCHVVGFALSLNACRFITLRSCCAAGMFMELRQHSLFVRFFSLFIIEGLRVALGFGGSA